MLNDHCHLVSTQLQSINIIIILLYQGSGLDIAMGRFRLEGWLHTFLTSTGGGELRVPEEKTSLFTGSTIRVLLRTAYRQYLRQLIQTRTDKMKNSLFIWWSHISVPPTAFRLLSVSYKPYFFNYHSNLLLHSALCVCDPLDCRFSQTTRWRAGHKRPASRVVLLLFVLSL
jgi:hypothetical protein